MSSISEPPRPDTISPTAQQRQAEASDARMALRHHEDEQQQKKKDREKEPLSMPEDVYDQTTLGVRAVIDFLKNFLKSIEGASPNTATPKTSQAPEQTQPPHNPKAARAANAYQTSARTATPSYIHEDLNAASTAPAGLLQTAEIRQVHLLLDKLNTLENNNVVGIKLFKAETFLQSLMNAADAALTKISGPNAKS